MLIHDRIPAFNDLRSRDLRTGLTVAGFRPSVIDALTALGLQTASDLLDIRNWQEVRGVGPKTCDMLVEFLAAQ